MAREDEFLDAVNRAVADFLRAQPELVRFADDYRKTALHWAAEKNISREFKFICADLARVRN